jgi:hypothetical protein
MPTNFSISSIWDEVASLLNRIDEIKRSAYTCHFIVSAAYRGSAGFGANAWCMRDQRGPKIRVWVHAYGRPHDELNNCDN